MRRSAPRLSVDPVWQHLTQSEDVAAAEHFFLLCQRSGPLRDWLFHQFAQNANVRAGFLKLLNGGGSVERWAAEVAGHGDAWLAEKDRLLAELPNGERIYGGLTRTEVEKLIRHYQSAGTVNIAAFLLAARWRKKNAADSVALERATAAFVAEVVSTENASLLSDFAKALRYVDSFSTRSRRALTVGYLDWWKLNLLLYILQNPRRAYRMRDFVAHLQSVGLQVAVRHIQRFCSTHKISRDVSSGRPRGLRRNLA